MFVSADDRGWRRSVGASLHWAHGRGAGARAGTGRPGRGLALEPGGAAQLGVLSALDEQAALEVFDQDCLIPLGTAVAPGPGQHTGEGPCMTVTWRGETHAIMPGELKRLEADRDVEEISNDQPLRKPWKCHHRSYGSFEQ